MIRNSKGQFIKGFIPIFTEEHKKNISIALRGRKLSESHRLKMIAGKLKNPTRYWLGKKRPNISKENHYLWKVDRSLIKRQEERNNPEYKQWRYECKKRDSFKCRINNQDCNGKIIVHHILSWKDYPELRYKFNNGITLCHFHHPKKREDEIKLIQTFTGLVMQTN